MFTGIVTAIGRVDGVARNGGNARGRGKGRGRGREGEDGLVLTIRAPFKGLKKGESIAVNGACLTIERVVKGGVTVHVIERTEGRTLFAEYVTGRQVNLERALREGDLVGAAERVTPAMVNFLATHARGLVCLTLMPDRCQALGLTQMAEHNTEAHEAAFTVSIDAAARFGVSTGISAADRAATVRVAIDPATVPGDLCRPGHVFPLRARPGGVLQRVGQTEASVDLARLAGLYPAGVICEILNPDGSMARRPDLEQFAQQ